MNRARSSMSSNISWNLKNHMLWMGTLLCSFFSIDASIIIIYPIPMLVLLFAPRYSFASAPTSATNMIVVPLAFEFRISLPFPSNISPSSVMRWYLMAFFSCS